MTAQTTETNIRIDKEELRQYLADLGPQGIVAKAKMVGTGTATEQKVPCVWHEDSTPSLSLKRRPSGDVTVKCFGCGESGDAIKFLAKVIGSASKSFDLQLVDVARAIGMEPGTEWDGTAPVREIIEADPEYPPMDDMAELFAETSSSNPANASEVVNNWFHAAGEMDVIPDSATQNLSFDWFRANGSWIILKAFDWKGKWRSVHARNIKRDYSGPKTIWPRGFSSKGLFLADKNGQAILRGDKFLKNRCRVIFLTEGITDTLSQIGYLKYRASENRPFCSWGRGWQPSVIGLTMSSLAGLPLVDWPTGNRVRYVIMTDNDTAGDKYAKAVEGALPKDAEVCRTEIKEDPDSRSQYAAGQTARESFKYKGE